MRYIYSYTIILLIFFFFFGTSSLTSAIFINPLPFKGSTTEQKESYQKKYSCLVGPDYFFTPREVWEGSIFADRDWEISRNQGKVGYKRKGNELIYHYQKTFEDEYFQRQTESKSISFTLDRESFIFLSPQVLGDKNGLLYNNGYVLKKTLSGENMSLRPRGCLHILEDTNNHTLWAKKPNYYFGVDELSDGIDYTALKNIDSRDAFIVEPEHMIGENFFLHEGRMIGEYYPYTSDSKTLYRFDTLISGPDDAPLTLYSGGYENNKGFFLFNYNIRERVPSFKQENIKKIIKILKTKLISHFCSGGDGHGQTNQAICIQKIKNNLQKITATIHYRHKAIIQKTISDRE